MSIYQNKKTQPNNLILLISSKLLYYYSFEFNIAHSSSYKLSLKKINERVATG